MLQMLLVCKILLGPKRRSAIEGRYLLELSECLWPHLSVIGLQKVDKLKYV